VSRRTIDFHRRIGLSASRSMRSFYPFHNPVCATCRNTQPNIPWWAWPRSSAARSCRSITWSGVGSSSPIVQNCRKHSESATRQANASIRCRSPQKKPISIQTEVHARTGTDGQLLVIKLAAAALAELVEARLVSSWFSRR